MKSSKPSIRNMRFEIFGIGSHYSRVGEGKINKSVKIKKYG